MLVAVKIDGFDFVDNSFDSVRLLKIVDPVVVEVLLDLVIVEDVAAVASIAGKAAMIVAAVDGKMVRGDLAHFAKQAGLVRMARH